MSDLIHITVAGRLTKDAELRQAGEQPVCGFRLAATPYRADEAMFFDVAIWGHRGEAIQQYLTKGQEVTVVGALSTEKWTTRDGEERTTLHINANEVKMHGGRRDDSAADETADASDGGSDEDPIKW